MTLEYSGTYKDKFGTEKIVITNDFQNISFRLGEFHFISRHLDDFELENYKSYLPEQIRRFTFETFNIYNSTDKFNELRDFETAFTVPVSIYNLKTNQSSATDLSIKMSVSPSAYDRQSKIFLKIVYNQKEFSATGDLFEGAANQLNKQINREFIIKACFWCLYSDYSVYGQCTIGSMMCYLKYKNEYLKVKDKDEYMDLPEDTPLVQEIYYCDSFASRRPGTGYRG